MSSNQDPQPPDDRTAIGKELRGRAQGLLGLFDSHPVIKLLVVLWVVGSSVFSPYFIWVKDTEADRRLGLLEPPAVYVAVSGDLCTMLNAGRRPVVEATMIWNTYWVDATSCAHLAASAGSHEGSPRASTRELQPRARLTTTYEGWAKECGPTGGPRCPEGGDCRMVIECEVRYHRMNDLERYTQSAFAISAPDCSEMKALHTLYSYAWATPESGSTVERINWKNSSDEQAYRCFLEVRSRIKEIRSQHLALQEHVKVKKGSGLSSRSSIGPITIRRVALGGFPPRAPTDPDVHD